MQLLKIFQRLVNILFRFFMHSVSIYRCQTSEASDTLDGDPWLKNAYEQGEKLRVKIEALRQSGLCNWRRKASKLVMESRLDNFYLQWQKWRGLCLLNPAIESFLEHEIEILKNGSSIQNLLLQNCELRLVYEVGKAATDILRKEAQAFQSGIELRNRIRELQSEPSPSWQDAAMKLIRQTRYEDPYQERMRLWGAEIFNKETEIKAERALWCGSTNLPKEMAMLGQALEIQKLFKDTHYAFTHGQQREFYLATIIYKEAARQHGILAKHFKPFRSLTTPSVCYSIETYSQNKEMDDSIPSAKRDLLSVSGNLFCKTFAESALHYFLNNKNCDSPRRILSSFVVNPKIASGLLKLIRNAEESPGILYVILVPKRNLRTTVYPSHAFGKRCCQPPDKMETILEEAQKGNPVLDCVRNQGSQYRIFLPNLTVESGCRSYAITPFKKIERKAIKSEVIKALARPEAFSPKLLSKL